MSKHHAISQHSLQARTVIGGVLAAGVLLASAPAGMALATKNPPPKPQLQTSESQELDKRVLAAFGQTGVGKAVFAHLGAQIAAGNQRDLRFYEYLLTAP